MGAYINQIDKVVMGLTAFEKLSVLMEAGAIPLMNATRPVQSPNEYQENMVCIVDNGWMGACAYAYSEQEFNSLLPTDTDQRPRYWFIFDRAKDFALPNYWDKKED